MSHVSHGNSLRNRLQVERLEDRRVLTSGMWHAWAPAVRSGNDVAAAAFSASDDSFEVANQMGSLHGQQRLSDSLGFGDRRDVFQFEIDSAAAEVALEIDGTWPVLSLQVYNDEGNLVGTKGSGSRLTLEGELTAGTYYAVVSSNSFFPVYYRLTADATPKQTTPADSAGSRRSEARDLGAVADGLQLIEYLDANDRSDYFRFTLDKTSNATVTLDQLSADADIYLAGSDGLILQASKRSGNRSERIDTQLSVGEYFLVVRSYDSKATSYQLGWQIDAVAPPTTPLVPTPTANDTPPVSNPPAETAPPNSPISPPTPSNPTPVDEAPLPPVPTTPQPTDEVETSPTVPVTPQPTNEQDSSPSPATPFPDVTYFGGANDWNLNAINAPEVWSQGYTGEGVVVAVVDTGVDWTHVDLASNIWTNSDEIAGDGIDNDRNGYVDDVYGWNFANRNANVQDANGHGTHVAGTIGSLRNGSGSTGVAYDAQIMPVKVLGSNGSGSDYAVSQGIRYAVDNGADVINLSLGGAAPSRTIYSALAYAQQHDVFVVIASGNESASVPSYPAAYSGDLSNVISVGAYDSNHRRANFSNKVGNSGALQVDMPGVGIYSTVSNGRYARYSGTSMASPHLAGTVALMLSANPALTSPQIQALLTASATKAIGNSDSVGGVNSADVVYRSLLAQSGSVATSAFGAAGQGSGVVVRTSSYLDASVVPAALDQAFESVDTIVPIRRFVDANVDTVNVQPRQKDLAVRVVVASDQSPALHGERNAAMDDAFATSCWDVLEPAVL